MRSEIHMEVNYTSLDFRNVTSCSLTGKCQASTFTAAKGDTIPQLKQATSNAPFEVQEKKKWVYMNEFVWNNHRRKDAIHQPALMCFLLECSSE